MVGCRQFFALGILSVLGGSVSGCSALVVGIPNQYVFPTPTPCSYSGKVLVSTASGVHVTDTRFNDWSRTITTANGLPDNQVKQFLIHRNLLMAATPQGLAVFKDDCSLQVREVRTTAQGLPSNDVKRLYNAPDGSLWAATASGVGRSTDGGLTFSAWITPSTPGMGGANFAGPTYGNVILFGGEDPNQPMVLFGFDNTLCRSVNGGSSFSCMQPSSIVNHGYGDYVTGLVRLDSGRIILSTGRGILHSTDEGVTWTPGTGLNNLWCNGLNRSPTSNALFVSTAGFSSYSSTGDGTGFTNYGAGSGGARNTFPLQTGHVLLATVTSGLFVAQSEAALTSTTPYTTAQGLLSNRVYWVIYLE